MRSLNYKEYIKGMHKLMGYILQVEDKGKCEKIIEYLRIYTDLIVAFNLLNKNTYKTSLELLRKVQRFTKEIEFKEEEQYLRKINDIAASILSSMKYVNMADIDEVGNPAHAKTKMLYAQNICILRILKLSS